MPKGPNGQKRPADAIGTAVMVGRIATGEVPDDIKTSSGKVRSGRAGGFARARSLTAEQKSSAAKKAAEKRWNLESAMANMSGTEKLTALLFNEGRELANIKFFPGSKKGLTVDELHGAAADAIRSAIEGGLVNTPPMSGLVKSRLA
jgi:hypothetical protein